LRLGVALDHLDRLALLTVRLRRRQQTSPQQDRRERGPQLVRYGGEEVVAGTERRLRVLTGGALARNDAALGVELRLTLFADLASMDIDDQLDDEIRRQVLCDEQ